MLQSKKNKGSHEGLHPVVPSQDLIAQHILIQNSNAIISWAQLYCKAPRLFVSDVAIVSDQSFEALCERSGKLSEPPQRQRA
ncbi:hypothetical protein [Desulfobotulus mexicanus]|uniref:Uncharacterized protein n=1 Tax=Desulfobotulus mexicanus TaxID=2586642 RepID=A0A5S5MCZ8_9BACT|nr:hypothetical protein [Desulfobotulus mexicanus]TYT73571.1 hypothetical protein FIM25_14295 [Desulfobotulus mexicanus]